MKTVTVKYEEKTILTLEEIAKTTNRSRSAVFREAAEAYANRNGRGSVGRAMAHLRGKYKDWPKDLSTNKQHLAGFGK